MELATLHGGEFAWLIAALVAGGLATGFLAGLFGVGGGGVLVPILYEVFAALDVAPDARMHLAIGTSLAVIIPTSLRSLHAHSKRGAVDWAVLRRVAPWVGAGVAAGIVIADMVNGTALKGIYVVAAAAMSFNLFFGRGRWNLGKDLPGNPIDAIVATVIGLISTLIGIGGGAQMTTYMTLYSRPIQQSVATSSGFGPIISIPAAFGYIWAGWGTPGLPFGSLGFVSMLGAAIIIPASVLAAPWGVALAHGISRRTLEIAFASFLGLVALRFLASLITG